VPPLSHRAGGGRRPQCSKLYAGAANQGMALTCPTSDGERRWVRLINATREPTADVVGHHAGPAVVNEPVLLEAGRTWRADRRYAHLAYALEGRACPWFRRATRSAAGLSGFVNAKGADRRQGLRTTPPVLVGMDSPTTPRGAIRPRADGTVGQRRAWGFSVWAPARWPGHRDGDPR